MPIYEYRCADCKKTFDIHQSFTEDSLTECPECAGRLKKVFGSVGIAFKGTGFYVNDSGSAKKSTSSTPSSDSTNGSGSTSKAGSTSDSGAKSSTDSGPKSTEPAKAASTAD